MSKIQLATRFTKLFGCQHPIVLPGMSWISTPELVAAVSNAGGLGILATGPLNAHETKESITNIRSLLKNENIPFGIGVTLMMPGASENAKIALSEQAPIINVSLGKPDLIANELTTYGGKLIATVTNTKHAQTAIDHGANAIMVTGHEAAAHGGDVTSLVATNVMRQTFSDIPIISAGGYATGRGLSAALSLGADAIAMGSRFAVTQESPLAETTKQSIVNASEQETIYGSTFDGIPARVLKTPVSTKAMTNHPWFPIVIYRAFEAAKTLQIPYWKVIPGLISQFDKMYTIAQFGAATNAIQAATVHGDLEKEGVQFIGQCQGLIHDIPTADDLIQRILLEAHETCIEQASQFSTK